MEMQSFWSQIKNNLVAIISLAVAIIALTYSAWREEKTEENRNTRQASFELLKSLGELQEVVNFALYQPDSPQGNPILGWGHIAMISDLGKLLPQPVPETVDHLIEVWKTDWNKFKSDETSADKITHEIDVSRRVIFNELYSLR